MADETTRAAAGAAGAEAPAAAEPTDDGAVANDSSAVANDSSAVDNDSSAVDNDSSAVAVRRSRGVTAAYVLGICLQIVFWSLIFLGLAVAIGVGEHLTEFRYVGF
ncbi:MAG: hypothetical protein ABR941_07030 [Thermoleophilia bacterium]